MDAQEKVIFSQLQAVANEHKLQCRAIYDIAGGRGWINYKKVDNNDYNIQLSTPEDFNGYNAAKSKIVEIFASVGSVLVDEEDYGKRTFGFQKELKFMDKQKYGQMKEKEEREYATKHIETQINGDISVSGGNFNTGTADAMVSTTSVAQEDKKWFKKEIVKNILSFIAGVASTVIAQLILYKLGILR